MTQQDEDDKQVELKHYPLRVVKQGKNRPERHLGAVRHVQDEIEDMSWVGRMPDTSPDMHKITMSWLADRLDNNQPKQGVPSGELRRRSKVSTKTIVIVLILSIFVVFSAIGIFESSTDHADVVAPTHKLPAVKKGF